MELLTRYLAKVNKGDKVNVLLANTREDGFLASLNQEKVDLSFIAEECSKERLGKLSGDLYVDGSYEFADKDSALEVYSKEGLAFAAFEALVSEMTPSILKGIPEDKSLEPFYLRKSSVEEKMQKS